MSSLNEKGNSPFRMTWEMLNNKTKYNKNNNYNNDTDI